MNDNGTCGEIGVRRAICNSVIHLACSNPARKRFIKRRASFDSAIFAFPSSYLRLTTDASKLNNFAISALLAPRSRPTIIIASLTATSALLFLPLRNSSAAKPDSFSAASINASGSSAERRLDCGRAPRGISPIRFFVSATQSSEPNIRPSSAR